MKDKTLQKILYIFIIINPILDILSGKFYVGTFSITMLLRPIIPVILLLYIFIKDRGQRKWLFILGILYVLYGTIHLYIYNKNITPFAYGNTFYEASYIINYTYLIFTCYLYIYMFKNIKDNNKLYESLFIHNLIYIISIFVAIITNTSNNTYVEGLGYIGWFNTGGAVGSIFVLSLLLLLPKIFENKKNMFIKVLYLISTYLYLVFLLGTRVGLFGAIITIIIFLVATIFVTIVKKSKLNKKVVIISLSSLFVFGAILYSFGSISIKRREMLDDLAGKNPVDETKETIYMAYDLITLKENIETNQFEDNYISESQKLSLFELDKYTKDTKYISTDLRGQQLLYHYFLYKNQKDISLKIFGNGYLSNMGMLTLEMETIALLFNFGIIGFILYFIPFFIILIYGIIIALKNIKKLTVNYIMLLAASFLSLAISFYSGHTYFNTSVMIIIIIINALLIIEIKKYKEES